MQRDNPWSRELFTQQEAGKITRRETNRQTDGQMDRWTDGQMDRHPPHPHLYNQQAAGRRDRARAAPSCRRLRLCGARPSRTGHGGRAVLGAASHPVALTLTPTPTPTYPDANPNANPIPNPNPNPKQVSLYTALRRALRPNGVLYHYIGDPSSKASGKLFKGVKQRLLEAGFREVRVDSAAYGVVATGVR